MYLFNKRSIARNFKLFLVSLGIKRIKKLSEILDLVDNSFDMECILAGFEYIPDRRGGLDEWKSNWRFIADGGGDCEDFALLVYKVLQDKGFFVTIYILAYNDKTKDSHAVCYFKKDRDEGVFSNHRRDTFRDFNIEKYCRFYGFDKYRVVKIEEMQQDFIDVKPIEE
jgi:hypothetical protein